MSIYHSMPDLTRPPPELGTIRPVQDGMMPRTRTQPRPTGFIGNLTRGIQNAASRAYDWMIPPELTDAENIERADEVVQAWTRRQETEIKARRMDIDNETTRRTAEIMAQPLEEGLLAYLNGQTRGKILNKDYVPYLVKLSNAYFAEVGQPDHILREKVMQDVIKKHLDFRLKDTPFLTSRTDIMHRASYINALNQGKRITYPFWYFGKPKVETIQEWSENESGPYDSPRPYSYSRIILTTMGWVAVGWTAKYLISRLYSNLTSGTTTQLAVKQLPLPSGTGIFRKFFPSTTPQVSTNSTDTSGFTAYILEYGPIKSMLVACSRPVKEFATKLP